MRENRHADRWVSAHSRGVNTRCLCMVLMHVLSRVRAGLDAGCVQCRMDARDTYGVHMCERRMCRVVRVARKG